MKKMSETVVFFGSGPVAAESLEFLAQHFPIEAVITKPQPPHHREVFPVLDIIKQRGLPAYYPTSKDELSALFASHSFDSKVGIVVDYGFMIGKEVIDAFPMGIVNSHFSLLPQWRGADPITFSILSGQSKTGVSLMLIEPKLDTGKLIGQKSLQIEPNDTTPGLTARLVNLSNQLLAEYLPLYQAGKIKPRQQPHPDRATYSRKLTKEDGRIDWSKPAEVIEREMRAYCGWPGSYTELGGKEVIITKASVVENDGPAGTTSLHGNNLIVYTGEQALSVEMLKPAGKPEMTAQAFLAGYKQILI